VTDDPVDIVNAVVKSDYEDALPNNVWTILEHYKEDEATSYEAPDPADETQQQIWKFT